VIIETAETRAARSPDAAAKRDLFEDHNAPRVHLSCAGVRVWMQSVRRVAATFGKTQKLDERSTCIEETLAIPGQSRLDLLSQMAFLPRGAVGLSYNH